MHRTDAHIAIALTGDGAPLDPAVHLLWSDCRGAYRLCPADREDMPTARSLFPLLAAGLAGVACGERAPQEPAWTAEVIGARLVEANGRLWFDGGALPGVVVRSPEPLTVELTFQGNRQPVRFAARMERRGSGQLLHATATPDGIEPGPGTLCVTDARTASRCWPALWGNAPDARPALSGLEGLDGERLRRAVDDLAGIDRIWLRHRVARALRQAGDLDGAIGAWRAAAEDARAAGLATEESRALRAAAFGYLTTGRLTEADALLARAEAALEAVDAPVDRARLTYYRALADHALSRYREATVGFERAADSAWRLADDSTAAFALDMLTVTLVEQGRAAEALEMLHDPRSTALTRAGGAIDRAGLLNNRAWIGLLVVSAGEASRAELDGIDRSLREASSLAGEAPERIEIRINQAWLGLLRDDLDAAADAIAQVPPTAGNPAAELIRADTALRRGRLDEAAPAFDRAARLAAEQSAGLPTDETWRAAYGRGRVAAARGDAAAALGHFRAALDGLDAVAAQAGVWHARARFYADRRPLVDDTARLLVSGGDLAGAFAVIDRTNARALRALEARTRLDRLPPAVRAEWEALQSRFAAARQAWDDARDDGELLDGAEAAAWQAAQAERRREMVAAFEAAEALLTREAPVRTAASDAEAIAAALPPKTALVAFGRLGRTVHAFWLEAERPIAHAVVEAAADAGDDDAQAAAALIAPFAARLAGLDHLYVVPGDVSAARALAIAPMPGAPEAPVGTRLSLSDLPYAGALVRPRRAVSGPVLVVADPTVDLPHAHAEGRRVAEALPDARLLARGAATREAVREAMSRVRAMHYAGHGVARADSPWQAHLALAGGTTLTVADILTADVPAGTVVLSGCRTGVRGALSDREALGLADAFVAAGSRAVLATRRDIPDEAAARFIARFHAEGGLDRPGPALRAATAAFFRLGDPIWSAFRLTGHP